MPTGTLRIPVAWAAFQHEATLVAGLALLVLLAEWPLLNGRIVAGLDSLTQFYPWYELLGATLRAGQLPGWNPYSFAGAPLAANPLTGWTYLPAMLPFTFLPLTPAVIVYQLIHVLLATLGSYALARVLGLRRPGAVLAAVAYGQSGLITVEAACCFAFSSVGAWFPLLLLGGELAIRANGWPGRVRGWSLAAVALSQIVAAWPGQGTYYAAMVFWAFVLFRAALRVRGVWDLRWIVAHGAIPVMLGVGLAAAGLLPRAELQMLSSLAGGYAPEDLNVGGWSIWEWAQLGEPGFWYAGLMVIGLALLAPVLAYRWPPTGFLAALGVTMLVLALPAPNPVADLFGLLPGFAKLHPHLPDRIMTVFMLVPALLAGAALDRLARGRLGLVLATLLIGTTFADLRLAREQAFQGYAAAEGVHHLSSVQLDEYFASSPAARFLQERMMQDGPFRYLGYGPDPNDLAYTQRFDDLETVRLGVNNRGVSDRLLDVQGYDAIHLARFDDHLRVANGKGQNYHNADVFALGLRSPLVDLLAARYIVVPSRLTGTPADPLVLDPSLIAAYDDGKTRVLENREALPWAWVVHDARPSTADEARTAIHQETVDPRQTALLEPPLRSPFALTARPDVNVPQLSGPTASASPDLADIVLFEADHLVIQTTTSDDSVLVLSEVAYPGWQATIDGRTVPILVANGLLRAVELPAGEHVVELRFVSPMLWYGVAVSLATMLVVAGGFVASFAPRRWLPV